MPVKKNKKMEPKLVAKDECSYISKTYKIPIKEVRKAKATGNKGDKPTRSRTNIYEKLRKMGYVIDLKDKKSKKVTVKLVHDKKGNLIL